MSGRIDPGWGLVVFDEALTPEILTNQGAGARNSAYTEAGPQPGHPVPADAASRWRPSAQTAQSADLSLLTLRGGYPGRAGAAVAYRLASESTAADWRGWSDPVLPTRWTAPDVAWTTAANFTAFAMARLPASHKLICTATTAAASLAVTWEFDPRTEAWSSLYLWNSGDRDGLTAPIGMAYDEEGGRLLLWAGGGAAGSLSAIAYQSTDGGNSWSIYARGVYDVAVTAAQGALRVATAAGLDWLAVVLDNNPGSSSSQQMASSDRGAHWEEVQNAMTGTQHTPIKTAAGWAVVYVAASTFYPSVRLLGSPRSDFNNAAQVTIRTVAAQNVWACVDDDGAIYVYSNGSSGASTRDEVVCSRSLDGGATWQTYAWQVLDGADAVHPEWWDLVASAGQVHAWGTQNGNSDTDGACALMSFGGWGSVEHSSGTDDFAHDSRRRHGYGVGGAGSASEGFYVPWDTPDQMGWTSSVGTGTIDLTPGEGAAELTGTGGTGQVYTTTAIGGASHAAGEIIWRSADSGNPSLAGIGTIATGPHFSLRIYDGSDSWFVMVDLASDGIQVRDGGTIRASDSFDTTAQYVHVRVHVAAGQASVWYRLAGGGGTKWTLLADGVTLTAGVVTTSVASFGCQIVSGGDIFVRMVGVAMDGDWRSGIDTVDDLDLGPGDGARGLLWGRPLPGAGGRYPCPDLTSSSEDMGYLTARGGPTYLTEQVSLPAAHVYGIEGIHPDRSPSPRAPWKTTDDSEVRVVWDLSEERWPGGAVALLAQQATPRQFVLEIDDGGAGWTTLGTLDKGWGSINFTRAGRVLVPRAGTATIDRYFAEGELVGGYVVISTSGDDVARRIARQSAGFWTTDSALQRMVIELEEVGGTEDTTTATGEIVAPSGLLIVYPSAALARRYLRVRIDASATSPDSVYEAGVLAIGRVVGVGADPSWDWTRRAELSRETSRRADGSLEVRRTGPPRRVVEYAWPDGVLLSKIRTLAAEPFRIATSAGQPIGSQEDAGSSLIGLIEHRLRSGEVPAVVVPRLPASDATITDPSLYTYGRLLSDSQGVMGFAGTEGVGEAVSVDGLAFEEIR